LFLLRYLQANGCTEPKKGTCIPCFEREYEIDGEMYMDVYIAME